MSMVSDSCGNVGLPTSGRQGTLGRFFQGLLTALLSWSKPVHIRPERAVENAFQDYLEGYFNSFDFYPVCTRQVIARNDAYALWSDFMKVAGDISKASEQLVISPEKFLKLGAISDEKLKRQKGQAAKSGIRRAIEEIKTK